LAYPLYVAFVWHMHQPMYRSSTTGEYTLPWVRLHATQNYLHMAQVLADYPAIHATFNFTPCLVEQLQEYAAGQALDKALAVTRKDTHSLEEREFILSFFFSINWDKVVRRQPRYAQLLHLREAAQGDAALFSEQYFRDLIAWFNLAWIDVGVSQRDPLLRRLLDKGQGFSREDVRAIADKQRELIGRVVPLYRQLAAAGQVELITSPYYHPILPLLMDSRAAWEASPTLPLPSALFIHAEDAVEQVRRALEAHARHFGERPRGLWPSEGAVSQALVDLLADRYGLTWLGSDEDILARSIGASIQRDGYGHVTNPRLLYQPYIRPTSTRSGPGHKAPLALVFRDHVLSDRIGFVYQHMDSRSAAADLVHRLQRIRENLADAENPYLVSIILDGENCWGEYENNGDDFLRHLYGLLSSAPDLRTVTVGEYLAQFPPRQSLARLAAGSWIGGNLETWIGEEAQNQAWEYLAQARERLVGSQQEYAGDDMAVLEQAWQEIYVAEGSDWFWWYYSHNTDVAEELFDREFRAHLGNVYRLLGSPAPAWLAQPLSKTGGRVYRRPPSAYVVPALTAASTAGPEWAAAGHLEPQTSAGAMQRAGTVLRRLYYGYDPQALALRLEANEDLAPYSVAVYFSSPRGERVNQHPRYAATNPAIASPGIGLAREVVFQVKTPQVQVSQASGLETWQPVASSSRVAAGPRALELSLPLSDLGLRLGDQVGLVVTLARDEVLVETLPQVGYFSFTLAEFR
jgi:alpha-amylase/alpha-mannosidase (GH57 family)